MLKKSDSEFDPKLPKIAAEVCAAQLEFAAVEFLRTLQNLASWQLHEIAPSEDAESLRSRLHSRILYELSIQVRMVLRITDHAARVTDPRGLSGEFSKSAHQFLQLFGERLATIHEWCTYEDSGDLQKRLASGVTSLISDLEKFILLCRNETLSEFSALHSDEPPLVTLQEVANLTRISVPTLRRYKKQNLLPEPAQRGAGAQPDRWVVAEITRRLRDAGKLR